MGSRFIVLLFLVCHVVALTVEVQAARWYNISREEEIDLEKQLKLLNKPGVKIIRNGNGDFYDCVDFYEQPGFDHPLLKDHKYEYKMDMKPTLLIKNTSDLALNENTEVVNSRFKGESCPVGTVPIRRISKDDLIREKYISKIRPLIDDNTPGAHYAVIRTKPSGTKYNGAGGQISLHNPQCTGQQYSAARVKVLNGPDSIEAGWIVDPSLHGDTLTRLYIRFGAGPTQCFYTRCPGFIVVNTEIPIDNVYRDVSKPLGTYILLPILLNRDLINGNWWFQIGPDEKEVGFWPASIFTGLSDWATSVEWGGEVFSPPGTNKPPMGVGENLGGDKHIDAYISQCILLDGKSTIEASNVDTFADSPHYKVTNKGNMVLYGGPSGP